MNNSCLIKSFPNGIVLHLDPEKPFADLLIDIAEKFSESRAFFKDAKMALAIKGRTLTEEEEIQVIDAITANSDLQIICLVGEDEETNADLSQVNKEQYNKVLNEADADYVLFLNKHYLKWQDTPLRTLFHFVSYSLYDRTQHEETKGNNYFTCMNLEKEAKLSKASRKSSSKIASEIIKSIDK